MRPTLERPYAADDETVLVVEALQALSAAHREVLKETACMTGL